MSAAPSAHRLGRRPAIWIALSAVVAIPRLARYPATAAGPWLERIDAEGVWAWLFVHHAAQAALAVGLAAALGRGHLERWGWNLLEWRWSLRETGRFALWYCALFAVVYGARVAGGEALSSGHALTAGNVVGYLSFQGLMSGTGEEPLFRALVMTLLLPVWSREVEVAGLRVPTAGLWATALFMLAHVDFTQSPPGFSWTQQFLSLGLGLWYAAAYHRTRSLLAPVLMHGASNVISVGLKYVAISLTA